MHFSTSFLISIFMINIDHRKILQKNKLNVIQGKIFGQNKTSVLFRVTISKLTFSSFSNISEKTFSLFCFPSSSVDSILLTYFLFAAFARAILKKLIQTENITNRITIIGNSLKAMSRKLIGNRSIFVSSSFFWQMIDFEQ